ncbi:MAG: acyltransferase [Spirochaetales bacterium]|jgi:acetyltransferase-like isoleucine patch superfamily enzyme
MIVNRIIDFWRRKLWANEKYARHIGVTIGNNCSIGTKLFSSEPYLIEIGNHVQITDNVRFFTHGGSWIFRDKYPNFDCFGKIKIGDNVYIGSSSIVLAGVTIGNNVIVGAGSVVTKSVIDNSIVAGNPAKVVGNVDDLLEKLLPFNLNTSGLSNKDKREFLMSVSGDLLIKK